MSDQPILEVDRLTRVFRRRGGHPIRAVDGMSWAVAPGEAVGYIGANGAGKSTTIKMITGILRPTSGTCAVGWTRCVGGATWPAA